MAQAVLSTRPSQGARDHHRGDVRPAAAGSEQKALRAELALRGAYTEGYRVQREIDDLTAGVLRDGPRLTLLTYDKARRRFSEEGLNDADAVRDFFQGTLGTRMTAMDLFDLADIAAPILSPTEVRIEHSVEEGEHALTLRMEYASDRFYDVGIERKLDLSVDRGRVKIEQNDIRLTRGTRGLGIGARFLLSTALFARRHGIDSWEEDLQDDGVLVWPRLGASITEDTMASLHARLEKLFAGSILSEERAFPERYIDIAAFTLRGGEIADWSAFHAWLMREGRVSKGRISDLPLDAIPVGALLLGGMRVSGEFRTMRILQTLLEERLPASIERRRVRLSKPGPKDAKSEGALRGLEKSFRRGLFEQDLSLQRGSHLRKYSPTLQPEHSDAGVAMATQLNAVSFGVASMLPAPLKI